MKYSILKAQNGTKIPESPEDKNYPKQRNQGLIKKDNTNKMFGQTDNLYKNDIPKTSLVSKASRKFVDYNKIWEETYDKFVNENKDVKKFKGGGKSDEVSATFGLSEVNIYPQNEFGNIARSQGINRARN